ncbi:MAG: CCA tRNA nucleotidyltransferase, partial [Thermodesulfobacteriota bacterium]
MLNDTKKIIEILAENGFDSYFVGGCVRDMIMKRAMTDIDITTAALPDDIMRVFPQENIYAVPTGLEHGTVTVVYNGLNVEVTTFRKDVSTDGRRSTVEFGTSLEEDLLRRDFTMNAIAYCPQDDVFIDPFGGRADIRRNTIRAVGVPIDRFREDYLRMLRAHRFESVLEFVIEGATWEALVSAASEEWCKVISVERIREEINKCFKTADKPSIMFEGMRKSDLLQHILPELLQCYGFEQNRYHEYNLYDHTLRTVDGVPKERHLVRWSALL